MKKLTQKVKTSLYENHIMMSKLCDLLNTSPNVIKEWASGNSNPRLLEMDVLDIISHYTKTPIPELTEPQTYDTPLPEAQPLDGGKTENEYLQQPKHVFMFNQMMNNMPDGFKPEMVEHLKYMFTMGFENGLNWQNAQFATDAGGGKESELREALQQATDFIQQWAQKPNEFELLKRCKSLLTAPSTHSSSEMVERIKETFMQWHHSYDQIGLHHSFVTQNPISDDNIRITTSTHDYVVFDAAGTWFLACIKFIDGEPNEEWTKQFNNQQEAKEFAENTLITQIFTIK